MKYLFCLLAFLAACQKTDYSMVCCQYYDGKLKSYVYTSEADYQKDVQREFGVGMEGALEHDSAHVMFVYCKEL